LKVPLTPANPSENAGAVARASAGRSLHASSEMKYPDAEMFQ
jgi:hypothetical protein